jgi:hypothetical protein
MIPALRLALRGRLQAEALMVDACTVRPVSGSATDPVTGVVSTTLGAPVYAGKCKLQRQRGAFPSTPDAGEHRWTVAPLELHLPVAGSGAVETGHVVVVSASVDPENVGRRFRVRSGDRKSLQTAIRFQLEEVVA